MKITETSFYYIGATIHDARHEIRERVEKETFLKDEHTCRNAERNLLQSNKRIEQELAWLPGVHPEIAKKLIKAAVNGQFSKKYINDNTEQELPPLAACNLLSETLHSILKTKPESITLEQFNGITQTATELYDSLNTLDELSRVNADRAIAGFGIITDINLLEEYIEKQRNELRANLYQMLLCFDEAEKKTWFSSIIEKNTSKAKQLAPTLLDELVTEYELEYKDYHLQLEQDIQNLSKDIRNALRAQEDETLSESAINSLNKLKEKLHTWSRSIYPILLIHKSKGSSCKSAETIIAEIRTLYIQAVEDYDNTEVFSILGDALSFVIDAVPKFASLVKEDLAFLQGRFRASVREKKIIKACEKFNELPASKNAIIENFQKLQILLRTELNSEIGEDGSDWLCLLFIKYGTALSNNYNAYEEALEIFKEALNYAKNPSIKKLLLCNGRKAEENEAFLQSRKRANTRKTILAIATSIIIAIFCILSLNHVNSSNYELSYISQLPLKKQIVYCKKNPTTKNKKELSKLLIRGVAKLPAEEQKNYIKTVKLDEAAAFEEVTTKPTVQSLNLFNSIYPDASSTRKQEIKELQTKLADQAWLELKKPYSVIEVNEFISTHANALSIQEIHKRVYSDLIKSSNAHYISLFLDFIESKQLKGKLLKRITDLEKKEWAKERPELKSVSALVKYRSKLHSPDVIALADKELEKLEETIWKNEYANSSSEEDIVAFLHTLHSDHVKALANQRLHELYSSFEFAQKVNTIEAYERFIKLSKNPDEKKKAQKLIVDLEVAAIASGEHSKLPPQHNNNSKYYNQTGEASIEIKNDTAYPLTVMYSGAESTKEIIPAHGTKYIRIRAGQYAIAVTTTQPNVTPFYGNENISAGSHVITYYIRSASSFFNNSTYSNSSSYSRSSQLPNSSQYANIPTRNPFNP